MRRALGRLVLAVAGFALTACGEPPPSIVLVTLDTVRCDHLGPYGSARGLSPHLDALAAAGLVHEHAFTTMPTTGPAHLSLFTGLYPSEHGSLANAEPLADALRARSLPAILRQRGYATAAFVTTPLLGPRVTGLRDFEIYDAPRGLLRPGSDAVEAALAWLRVESRRPLFLWVHLYDAHAPYGDADEKRRSFPVDAELYGFVSPERFASEEMRERMARLYAQGVRDADTALGQLLLGLVPLVDPLVVVTGDHGEILDEVLGSRGYAYDHGDFLDRQSVCVPLVLRGPGVEPGRSAAPVSLRDVHHTVALVAGLSSRDETGPDLRRSSGEKRLVVVERKRIGPRAGPGVRAHATAAFDAGRALVLGDDGRDVAGSPEGGPPDLRAAALRHLAALAQQPGTPSLEPGLREALEALGYTDGGE